MRRDRELAKLADLHAGDALVPAFDDLPGAELERESAPAIARAVELLSVGERAHVVHGDGAAGFRLRAGAGAKVLDDELVGHGGGSFRNAIERSGTLSPRARFVSSPD